MNPTYIPYAARLSMVALPSAGALTQRVFLDIESYMICGAHQIEDNYLASRFQILRIFIQ